ncbi:MAG TPA: hypothetical protein VLB09_01750 [Nitrospiria bacterium]|nr:hypothetical protein [Nitrospiria bacterium]
MGFLRGLSSFPLWGRASIFLFCIFIGAGCGGDPDSEDAFFVASLAITSDLGAPRSEFTVSEIIRFNASLRNLSESPQSISFSTDPFVDYIVQIPGEPDPEAEEAPPPEPQVIWRLSEGGDTIASIQTLVFSPNEIKKFSFDWDQTLAGGGTLEPGSYSVKAVFLQGGGEGGSAVPGSFESVDVLFNVIEDPEEAGMG